MINKIRYNFNLIIFVTTLLLFSGCKKFLDVEVPANKIEQSLVFSSDVTATSAVNGMYGLMYTGFSYAGGSNRGISILCGLSADELNCFNQPTLEFYPFFQNTVSQLTTLTSGPTVSDIWGSMFKTIYQANDILEALNVSTGITSNLKKQLIGEAHFCRAFAYFYLVNLFGNVPLITTTSYQQNALAPKAIVDEVYSKIIADLTTAQLNLENGYVSPGERIRPNKATATALLARVYLYTKQWQKAEEQSSLVINDPLYSLHTNLDSVFLGNSTEAIWQLKPNTSGRNTNEAILFVLTGAPNSGSRPVWLTNDLFNSFETGDLRRQKWVNSSSASGGPFYYAYKYKLRSGPPTIPVTEFSMVFRLSEMFLIRAEARANSGNISGASTDLNTIRNRAGLPNTSAIDTNTLLNAIQQERRVELFTEWGHRWLDLKRWNIASMVLSSKKPNWNGEDVLYPIPQNEINLNPNLNPQNPGY